MKIGTKSVLFGVHQFALHPWFVAWAWFKLYGFRTVSWVWHREEIAGHEYRAQTSIIDPRLWLAFFLHDIGYLGKPNMDGAEGELHPYVGAQILGLFFGTSWYVFVLSHSRFLAKQLRINPSPLCIADKLAITLPPAWLYLALGSLTGEIDEYMALSDRNNATGSKYAHMHPTLGDKRQWHQDMCDYVRRWVEEHKDGRVDTWTPGDSARSPNTASGVYR